MDVSSGDAYILESGTFSNPVAYAAGDRFSIVCDSGLVRYYQNGVLHHTTAVSYAVRYLDSSFYNSNGVAQNLTFGPVESVGTDQIDPESATSVFSAYEAGPVIEEFP
jgi:hypothetical protein